MPQNTGLKFGIYLGVFLSLYSLFSYLINPKWMFTGAAYLTFLFPIIAMYFAAREERTKNEGLLSFGEGLKATFLTYVIGKLIHTIFIYLMLNHIDPSLMEVMKEVSIEQAEWVAGIVGAEEQLDDLPDKLDEQAFEMNFSLLFMDYLMSLIIPGFLLALVIAAITKRDND